MKRKERRIRPSDLLAILALAALPFAAVSIGVRLLFGEELWQGELNLTTERLDYRYRDAISPGDPVYDPLTKRTVGRVRALGILDDDGGFRYLLSIDAERKPRGKALRTRELWFEYTEEVEG